METRKWGICWRSLHPVWSDGSKDYYVEKAEEDF